MKIEIDKLDSSILKSLQEDCSLTYKQIARNLNISSTTICDRLQWLKKNSYINRFVAILNRKKLNQEILSYIHLKLNNYSDDVITPFKQDLSQIKEVCECCGITGHYNIRLKIVAVDIDTLSRIKRDISGLRNVQEIHDYIVVEELITDMGFNFI